MNFLSHHFLQSISNSDYYSIGITLPDILTLHNNLTVLNRNKFTYTMSNQNLSKIHKKLLKGMADHMYSDKIFHSSKFFKDHLQRFQLDAASFGMKPIPEIIRHILLEILMDRYIILNYPYVAENFYELYNRFNFRSILPLLHSFANFTDPDLLDYLDRFNKSRFLLHYKEIKGVSESIKRVNSTFNSKYKFDDSTINEFNSNLYKKYESNIAHFFSILEKKHTRGA
jgi:hypothetical protein